MAVRAVRSWLLFTPRARVRHTGVNVILPHSLDPKKSLLYAALETLRELPQIAINVNINSPDAGRIKRRLWPVRKRNAS